MSMAVRHNPSYLALPIPYCLSQPSPRNAFSTYLPHIRNTPLSGSCGTDFREGFLTLNPASSPPQLIPLTPPPSPTPYFLRTRFGLFISLIHVHHACRLPPPVRIIISTSKALLHGHFEPEIHAYGPTSPGSVGLAYLFAPPAQRLPFNIRTLMNHGW